jgi:hypothetical protein
MAGTSPAMTFGARLDCRGRRVGLIESVLDERMFECSFSFMKSSPVSSQSIWASIAAANFGMALLKEKSGISNLIF